MAWNSIQKKCLYRTMWRILFKGPILINVYLLSSLLKVFSLVLLLHLCKICYLEKPCQRFVPKSLFVLAEKTLFKNLNKFLVGTRQKGARKRCIYYEKVQLCYLHVYNFLHRCYKLQIKNKIPSYLVSQCTISSKIKCMIFFFNLGFCSWTFTIHRTVGEGGSYFFNFSVPLPPASQTPRH